MSAVVARHPVVVTLDVQVVILHRSLLPPKQKPTVNYLRVKLNTFHTSRADENTMSSFVERY